MQTLNSSHKSNNLQAGEKHWRVHSKQNDCTMMFTTMKSPRIPTGTCFSSLDICFLASDWALKYWLMWVKSHLLRLVIVLFSSEVISLQKESSALSFHIHQLFMHRAYPTPGSLNRNNRQVLIINPRIPKFLAQAHSSWGQRGKDKQQILRSIGFAGFWSPQALVNAAPLSKVLPHPDRDCWGMGRKSQKHIQENCIKII